MQNFDKKVFLVLKLNLKLKSIDEQLNRIDLNFPNPIMKKYYNERFIVLMRNKINITTVLVNTNYLNY